MVIRRDICFEFIQFRHISAFHSFSFFLLFFECALRRDTNACVSYRNDVKHQMKIQYNGGKRIPPLLRSSTRTQRIDSLGK